MGVKNLPGSSGSGLLAAGLSPTASWLEGPRGGKAGMSTLRQLKTEGK